MSVGVSVVVIVVLVITIFVAAIAVIASIHAGPAKTTYHVLVVSRGVATKPDLPSTRNGDHTVVINQSSFVYTTDPQRSLHEFRVKNKRLTTEDLATMAREVVPEDGDVRLYIY